MEWRPVPTKGYEQHYSVSDQGSIRRERRGPGTRPGFMLKPRRDKDGYGTVVLWKNNVPKYCKIHALVLAAFLGPKPKGKETNHKDGIKLNNHLENLEYVTPAENNRHAWRNLPRKPRTRPTHCRRGHLYTPETTVTWNNLRKCRICRNERRRQQAKGIR